jgi:indole-3-glycerol phosphate synthase
VQARTLWSLPTGPLGRLTTQARARAAALGSAEDWEVRAADTPPSVPFRDALLGATVAVIAEVKRRSPSKGALNPSMDPAKRARLYQDGGANAISVLTEPLEFGGSSDDLTSVLHTVTCPLLKKDFHVDPVQMFEARVYGASAALLIVRALGADDTRIMADAARQAGVEPVFEVRDEQELSQALDAGAIVIGVNQRNLETLEMEPDVPARLLPLIPSRCVAVAESGISTRADVERAAESGADAVLVGSALSLTPDPKRAVSNLTGVTRSRVRG